WDRGAEFQQDLGVWRAVTQAATMAPETYSLKAAEGLDRRPELRGAKDLPAVGVTVQGKWVDPAGVAGLPASLPYDTRLDWLIFEETRNDPPWPDSAAFPSPGPGVNLRDM